MTIKRKPSKRGQKAKETKHAFPMDWLDEAVRSSAEAMDYTQATGKQLAKDFFWAVNGLDQLLREIRGVGECMQDQRLQSNTELTRLQLAFWAEAFRLLPYFMAVLTTAAPEIVKRANRNQSASKGDVTGERVWYLCPTEHHRPPGCRSHIRWAASIHSGR